MKKLNSFRYTYLLISVIAAFLSTSCGNVYEPFAGGSSDIDLVEKAQKCLKDNDYACAIAEYSQIQNPELKSQKLCLAYLGQTGFTIPFLLDVVKAGGSNMLGTLTNRLLPWSQARQDSIISANTQCADYLAITGATSNIAVLLDTLSKITNCAVRIGRVDQVIGVDENDTACTTAGAGNGTIEQADISGSLGTGPGMCKTDVDACRDSILDVDAATLDALGFTDIKNAYDQIPADLKNSGAVTSAIRVAIRSAFSN